VNPDSANPHTSAKFSTIEWIRLRGEFQDLLNAALTRGEHPGKCALGSRTIAALTVVANEHPWAGPDHVVGAYDAFACERGEQPGLRVLSGRTPPTISRLRPPRDTPQLTARIIPRRNSIRSKA
jgi:hypothetical protein